MMTPATRSTELCHSLFLADERHEDDRHERGPQRIVLFQEIADQPSHQDTDGHGKMTG